MSDDLKLGCDSLNKLESMIRQINEGMPVAYILGKFRFWGLDLKINSSVLIPRFDTENLVKSALKYGCERKRISIVDVGTGSGAVALAIAHARPGWEVWGTDISPEAIELAVENGSILNLKIEWVTTDLLRGVNKKFDLLISNPPYVKSDKSDLEESVEKYEPQLALNGGHDGMQVIKHILSAAKENLKKNAFICLEHSFDQAEKVFDLSKQFGYQYIEKINDMSGKARVSVLKWEGT